MQMNMPTLMTHNYSFRKVGTTVTVVSKNKKHVLQEISNQLDLTGAWEARRPWSNVLKTLEENDL